MRNRPSPDGHHLRKISEISEVYNGFNLLTGDRNGLFHYSNKDGAIQELKSGLYGLSNHLLDTPWPKVKRAKAGLEQFASGKTPLETSALLGLLSDTTTAKDHLLPDTGVGKEIERTLSPMFIKSPDYGTRSTAALLIDRNGRITFAERTYPTNNRSAPNTTAITRCFSVEMKAANVNPG